MQGCEISQVHSNGNYTTVIGLAVSNCSPSGSDHVIIKQNDIHHIYTQGLLGGSYSTPYGMYVNNSPESEFLNNIVNDVVGGNYNNSFGVRFVGSNDTSFVNNVVYYVRKSYYYGTAYGVHISNCTGFDGRNNIVNRILGPGYFQSAYGVTAPAGTTWEYCDVYQVTNSNYSGGISPGTGCISANPLFTNPGTDFHLQNGSPCINTGDPNSIYNDPDGTRNDMGCYGGPYGNW